MKNTPREVRVSITIEYTSDKSVVGSVKAKDLKAEIAQELGQIAEQAYADFKTSDLKVRFLRK